MKRFFLALVLFSSSLPAAPALTQLVAWRFQICLLAFSKDTPPRRQFDCWKEESGSKWLPKKFPALTHPTSIADCGGDVCGIQDGKLVWVKWYDDEDPDFPDKGYPFLAQQSGLVELSDSGWGSQCVTDREQRVWCEGEAIADYQYHDDPHAKPLRFGERLPETVRAGRDIPSAVASDGEVACAIGDDLGVHCWSAFPNRVDHVVCARQLEYAPKDWKHPSHLRVHIFKNPAYTCEACALDDGREICWGTEAWRKLYSGEVKPIPGPKSIAAPVSAAAPLFALDQQGLAIPLDEERPYHCALSHQRLYCLDEDDDDPDRFGETSLPFAPLAVADNGSRYCVVGRDEIYCPTDAEDRDPEVRISHGQYIATAGAATLRPGLETVAQKVYAPTAVLLRAVAKQISVIESWPADARERGYLYLMEAIDPVMAHVDSTYFSTEVLPQWNALRDTLKATAPKAGPAGEMLPVALPLLEAAAQEWKTVLPADDFLLALGNAMAAPAQGTAKLLAAYAPLRESIDRLAVGNGREAAAALLTQRLFATDFQRN